MHQAWDEEKVAEQPFQVSLNFDSLVDSMLLHSIERDSYTFPWAAVSITSSATMHELRDSEREGFWERLNKRRIFLIDRELSSSLNEDETTELEWLQARLASYVDAIAPLPFAELEAFEALIDGQQSGGGYFSDSP